MITVPITKRQITFASLANLVYMALNSLLFLFVTPLVLIVLGEDLYGLWTILLAFLNFSGLASLGVGQAMVKYVAQYRFDPGGEGLSAAVTFGYLFAAACGGLAVVVLGLARSWAAGLFASTQTPTAVIADSIGVVAIGLLPLLLYQVSQGILLGLMENQLAGGMELLQNVLLWGGGLLIGWKSGSLYALAVWILVSTTLLFLVTSLLAWGKTRRFQLRLHLSTAQLGEMIQFSLLSWTSSLGIVMFQSMDRVIVGALIGPAAAGVYGIANSIALRLSMLAGQFTQVLTPVASSLNAGGYEHEVKDLFRKVSRFVSALLVAVGSILVFWMDWILRIWISPEFSAQYTYLFRVLVIAYTLFSMSRSSHQVLTGLGRVRPPALNFFLCGALMLAGVYVLTRAYGLNGAAYANFVLVGLLAMHVYLLGYFRLKFITVFEDLGVAILLLAPVIVFGFGNLEANLAGRVLVNGLVLAILAWWAGRQSFYRKLFYALRPDGVGRP
ncbi:MAG: oligosaccharide flippase family protein [Chloroflexi bacterium]|nr:oligosaccharide flippase family protein [Chloroflexota bacterium]